MGFLILFVDVDDDKFLLIYKLLFIIRYFNLFGILIYLIFILFINFLY